MSKVGYKITVIYNGTTSRSGNCSQIQTLFHVPVHHCYMQRGRNISDFDTMLQCFDLSEFNSR